jgi:hypothetical protein
VKIKARRQRSDPDQRPSCSAPADEQRSWRNRYAGLSCGASVLANGIGDVVLIGSAHCAGTLRVKEFLGRNGHPYHSIDLDTDPGVQELFDQFGISQADIPVLICRWRSC